MNDVTHEMSMLLPTTPVLAGFYPDPSVCVVDGVYYLANSSFEYAPGVPIHRSPDLRTWELVGHALGQASQLNVRGAVASGGIFAPTLRHHGGRFWMITTNITDSSGSQLLVTAEDAAGSWSDPVLIPVGGIDPDLAWDEDGTCYLTRSGFGVDGPEGIVQVVIDPDTGEVLSESRPLWQGTGGTFPEGPHLYRVGRFWYLLIAEGGTERGHAATIARSSSPSGPFVASPLNPLVTARGRDSPVQNTGHADLVRRPDGSWALVYLGVRPRGTSPQWHVLGRETFASEIVWVDGWPLLGDPIHPGSTALVEELLPAAELSGSWVGPGHFPTEVMTRIESGWRLRAGDGGQPRFAGRRQTHLFVDVRAEVDASRGRGGVELRVDPRHSVRVEHDGDRIRAFAQIGSVGSMLGETRAGDDCRLGLRVEASHGDMFSTEFGPDEIVAYVSAGTESTVIGRLDGRYVSTEVAGGMTGRVVGVFCSSGEVIVRSFTYWGSDEPAE